MLVSMGSPSLAPVVRGWFVVSVPLAVMVTAKNADVQPVGLKVGVVVVFVPAVASA
tara:strand:+ start:423 stop:590 length:168 start_codon:yes stop_codon:yes gene_type:complete